MKNQRFAVVDVETTGGYAGGHRITEVGVVLTDGHTILDTFHSLVNPETQIPQQITRLTGITNHMVQHAPTFSAIAPRLTALFNDAVFVAHNVNFDYSFIRMEMARIGQNFTSRKLCTARYARSLLKDQERFGLANLAKRFAIVNEQPHRALSDAITAALILHQLLQCDTQAVLAQKISRLEREVNLPLYLSPAQFHAIPNIPGIYMMYGKNGKPIYIGKAKRLKQRISQHFMQTQSARTQAFMHEVVRIETHPTGTELMALVKEDVEIRKHWPKYNQAQKQRTMFFHVVRYTDRAGLYRLGVHRAMHCQDAIKSFSSYREALLWLHQAADYYQLNAAWYGLGRGDAGDETNTTAHNNRVDELLAASKSSVPERILLLPGRSREEKGFIWLQHATVHALGFAPMQINWRNKSALMAHAERVHASTTLNNLVLGYMASAKSFESVVL